MVVLEASSQPFTKMISQIVSYCLHLQDQCLILHAVFVKATEKASIAAGQIFDACNDFVEGGDAILEKLAKVSGVKDGYSWIEPTNGLCLNSCPSHQC